MRVTWILGPPARADPTVPGGLVADAVWSDAGMW